MIQTEFIKDTILYDALPSVGKEHRKLWHRVSIAICAAALVYSIFVLYFGCFFGAVFEADEPYMALNCKYYGDGPLAMLSFYIGHVAQSIFGEQLIVLRLLSRTWILAAIAIPLVYFYRRCRNLAWTFGLGAFMVLFYMGSWNLFWGWDVGPLVWESALFTLLISFIDKPTLKKGATAGALCALMVLSRVTTAALGLPLVAAVFLMMRKKYNGFTAGKFMLYAAVAFLVTALITVMLMKGSVTAYIESWIPENIINGHNHRDIWKYIYLLKNNIFVELLGYQFWLSILVMAGIIELYLKVFRWKGMLVVPIIIWYLGLRCIFVIKDEYMPHYFVPLVFLLYPYIRKIFDKKCNTYPVVKLVVILLFPLVTGFASDRMLKHSVTFFIIPEMVLCLYPYRNGIIRWLMVLAVGQSLMFHAYRMNYFIDNAVPAWNDYRYHEHIRYFPGCGPDDVAALKPYIDTLRANGVEYVFMGEYRYLQSYLLCDEKPYHLNHFHFYYEDESIKFLEDCLKHEYVVITSPGELSHFPYASIVEKAEEMGATVTHNGKYDYIEPPGIREKLGEKHS